LDSNNNIKWLKNLELDLCHTCYPYSNDFIIVHHSLKSQDVSGQHCDLPIVVKINIKITYYSFCRWFRDV